MRLVILSDIHGNLEALEAVLKDARERSLPGDVLVCLGDVVGYGADPEATAGAVREAGAMMVLGNHEMGLDRPEVEEHFNPQSWEAVRWAASRLSPGNLAWLSALPTSLSIAGCRFVHGLPPDEVDTYLSQTSRERLRRAMATIPEEICFVGHTHLLGLWSLADGRLVRSALGEDAATLSRDARHLVNAGSVGQPRDGDLRAKYCLFDPATRELRVRFVDYDAEKAAEKILASGQPRVFAERLLPRRDP